ncbi:MAG: immunoglobulin-like domain-containing protein [Psychrobium sp.]
MVSLNNDNKKRSGYQKTLLAITITGLLAGCGGSSTDDDKKEQPKVDTTPPMITINGTAVTLEHGETYTEQGASAIDDTDGTVDVTTTGAVDNMTLSQYTITYKAVDAAGNETTATRQVDVVDTTEPVLTLNGASEVNVVKGQTYEELSASATDAVDGDVTVTTEGSVDIATIGSYNITYIAKDASDNESRLTRTVHVVEAKLKGTAAAGAPIVGTVTVKDATGAVRSKLIEANGDYEVDVTGMQAPFRIRAEGTVGGRRVQLHSYTNELTADGVVNVTPFTDLIVANAAQQIASNFFDSTADESLSDDDIEAQETALQSKLQDVFDALGVDSAIDLLNTSFSADHSGLDAALDVIRIENTADNIMRITNIIDGTSITDDVSDSDDNETKVVADKDKLTGAISDTVAVANLFDALAKEFAAGLPKPAAIEDFFADDFVDDDESVGELLTDLTTDPDLIGFSFDSVSVEDIDLENKTAKAFFNTTIQGVVDPSTEMWIVAKDDTKGWQIKGNQRIADIDDLHFHCNDYNGSDDNPGGCGINASVADDNPNNNGTDGKQFQSALVTIIDGDDGETVKETIYLGLPEYEASNLNVYNPVSGQYNFDWAGFGSGEGEIDVSKLAAGDKVTYQLYTANLDLTNAQQPAVTGESIVTYYSSIPFAPATTGLYPKATATTAAAIAAIGSRADDDDLTLEWTLADGTINYQVLVELTGTNGNYAQMWEYTSGTDTQLVVDASNLNAQLFENSDFDFNQNYEFVVRIYAQDKQTGQLHSTDYRQLVEYSGGGDSTPPDGNSGELNCGFESPWNDATDMPASYNSFTDFETVVEACGGVQAVTRADFASKTFVDGTEKNVFNDDGEATLANPGTGTFIGEDGENQSFTWYFETVNQVQYLVVTGSNAQEGIEFRDTFAITALAGTRGTTGSTMQFKVYAEQSNYTNSDMVRLTGSDGEIWGSTVTQE